MPPIIAFYATCGVFKGLPSIRGALNGTVLVFKIKDIGIFWVENGLKTISAEQMFPSVASGGIAGDGTVVLGTAVVFFGLVRVMGDPVKLGRWNIFLFVPALPIVCALIQASIGGQQGGLGVRKVYIVVVGMYIVLKAGTDSPIFSAISGAKGINA